MITWCTSCGNPIIRGGAADFVRDMANGGFKHSRCDAREVVDDVMQEVRARQLRNWRDIANSKRSTRNPCSLTAPDTPQPSAEAPASGRVPNPPLAGHVSEGSK